MSLHYPWLLLLLLLVPLITWWRFRSRRRTTLTYSSVGDLRGLPVTPALVIQPLLPALYAAGLALLVVVLARPQKGLSESRVKTQGVDIVLLVDVSTSMRAIDLSTQGRELNRLDAAKQVIERFVKKRENDRIGIVAFSALPYSVAPLTLDHAWLVERLRNVQTGMLEDGTAIGDGIASAVNRLRESKAKSKVVVLLTDGINNRGSLTPDNAAQAAKALGIKVYAVGAGATGDVAMPMQDPFGGLRYVRMRSDIDDDALTRIAEATGARYFRATDYDSLINVYDQIDKMEKTEIDVEQYTRFEERFAPFLIAALVCLIGERALGLSRFGRLP